MYTQFFGNFLINRNVITPEQLITAISKESTSHLKLGTLAMYHNLMSASEVDAVIAAQKQDHKSFQEVAVRGKYLTKEQVGKLLTGRSPEYLLLGQLLVETGTISNSDLEVLINDYEAAHEILDLDLETDQKEQVTKLIRHYFKLDGFRNSEVYETYLDLLFNNLIHFIGPDFTLLSPILINEFPTQYSVIQRITGKHNILSAIDMDRTTAIEFASRYVTDAFEAFDEYVQASLEDFINLHNGLFTVNMSNNYGVELQLSPPGAKENALLDFAPGAISYMFPVMYPFGTINFVLSF